MSETALAGRSSAPLPALVVSVGERAGIRFLEFFALAILNQTRDVPMRMQ